MRKSIIMVVLDGAADRPVPVLGGRTPLEVARTPFLDKFAREGACGLMDVLGRGIVPGSDTAQMMLLGYDPRVYYTGRGALEAIGGGIDVRPGDLCFRANFSSVVRDVDGGGGLIVVDRRAGRHIAEIQEIMSALSGFTSPVPGIEVKLVHTTQHRGAFLMRGKNLSSNFIDTDPHDVNVPLHEFIPRAGDDAARKTVEVIHAFQDYAFKTLDQHPVNEARREKHLPPVNMVLFRGQGFMPELDPFQVRHGVSGAFVCGNALISGVCISAGLKPALTVDDMDFKKKLDAAFTALQENEFLFFHVKEVDNLSHDHDMEGKIQLLEKLDDIVFRKFSELDPGNKVLAITADHATPVTIGEHVGDPVPVIIWGEGVRRDDVGRFDERSASRGGLSRFQGRYFLQMLLNLAGKVKKFGY
ncbi:MAG: 2,3-bisphosphoglycerate-independent phosphoglycerate mutase [Promethearchaeota archaeon]